MHLEQGSLTKKGEKGAVATHSAGPPAGREDRLGQEDSSLPASLEEPKDWSFSFSIRPSSEHSELISSRMDWLGTVTYGGVWWVRDPSQIPGVPLCGSSPLLLSSPASAPTSPALSSDTRGGQPGPVCANRSAQSLLTLCLSAHQVSQRRISWWPRSGWRWGPRFCLAWP